MENTASCFCSSSYCSFPSSSFVFSSFCFSVCIAPWIWRVQVMGLFCGAPKRTFCSRLPRCVWRMFHLGHFLHENPKSKKNHPIQAILLGPLTLSLLAAVDLGRSVLVLSFIYGMSSLISYNPILVPMSRNLIGEAGASAIFLFLR